MAGTTFRQVGSTQHNAASVAAGSDIIAAAQMKRTGILHIVVAVGTSTTVQLGIENAAPGSGTEELIDLNGGVALAAGVLYSFTVPSVSGYSYALVNKTGATATTIMHAAMFVEVPVG